MQGEFRSALLRCRVKGLLRLVIIGELHLFAQHGGSFRTEIRMICHTLLKPIFSLPAKQRPFILQLTATLALTNMGVANALMSVRFPPAYWFWATAEEFAQENTEMRLICTSLNHFNFLVGDYG